MLRPLLSLALSLPFLSCSSPDAASASAADASLGPSEGVQPSTTAGDDVDPIDATASDGGDAPVATCPVCPACPLVDAAPAPEDAGVCPATPGLDAFPALWTEWEGGAPHARALYVSDGDSIAFGYYAPSGQAGTALAAAFAGEGVAFKQIATPGAGITGDAGEDSTFATRVLPLIRKDVPTIVSQNAGINDNTATPQQVWDAQAHYCAQVRAAGAKCILLSLMPREGNSYGHLDAIRQLQHDHWQEVADGFVDFALEPQLADASDRTEYVDGLHPTPSGQVAMFRRILPVLLDVLADAGVAP